MAPPPPPRSFGIIELGGDSRQIFGFKGVAGKVFQNQQLTLSKSAENGFGAVSRAERSFASLRISAAGSPLRLRSGSPPLDASTSKLPQSDLNRHARRVLSQWISITDGCDEKGQIWERIVSAEFSIATWGEFQPPKSRRGRDEDKSCDSIRRFLTMSLFCRWGFLEAPVLQHRLRVGWRTAPGLVHSSEILSVTAREDHLTEAVAVSTRQAAMFDEPLEGVVGEHLGPKIGVVAGAVAVVSPDVGEIGRAIARRYVADIEVSLIERLFLELIGVLERGRGWKRVPLHVEFGRGQEFGHVIALVENVGFP